MTLMEQCLSWCHAGEAIFRRIVHQSRDLVDGVDLTFLELCERIVVPIDAAHDLGISHHSVRLLLDLFFRVVGSARRL